MFELLYWKSTLSSSLERKKKLVSHNKLNIYYNKAAIQILRVFTPPWSVKRRVHYFSTATSTVLLIEVSQVARFFYRISAGRPNHVRNNERKHTAIGHIVSHVTSDVFAKTVFG